MPLLAPVSCVGGGHPSLQGHHSTVHGHLGCARRDVRPLVVVYALDVLDEDAETAVTLATVLAHAGHVEVHPQRMLIKVVFVREVLAAVRAHKACLARRSRRRGGPSRVTSRDAHVGRRLDVHRFEYEGLRLRYWRSLDCHGNPADLRGWGGK